MKRTAFCPKCELPINGNISWSKESNNFRTCPGCHSTLRRVDTDAGGMTALITLLVLGPASLGGLLTVMLWPYFGVISVLAAVIGVAIAMAVNYIQYPYTNAFEQVEE